MGSICLSQGREGEAEGYLRKALEINPSLPSAHLYLGRLYEKRHSDELAIGHYRRAMELAQSSGLKAQSPRIEVRSSLGVLLPSIRLGALYERQGKREEAQKVYEEALTIDPGFAPALNNLAWLYAEKAETLDQALSLAQRAKEALPEDPLVSDTLGWILYQKGLYPTAIRSLQEAVEKVTQIPTIHYHLGLAYWKNGEADTAKGALKEALWLGLEGKQAGEARRLLGERGISANLR